MPLDRHNGEVLDGLMAGAHVVIEARHLASLSNYHTEYQGKHKFIAASTKKPTRPVFDDAVANAIAAFADKGALHPVRFNEDDVVVQVYPKDLKVAVIFQRAIAGEVHYAPSYYDLPKPVLDALLEASGKRVPSEH
jgi:hypothetical protein